MKPNFVAWGTCVPADIMGSIIILSRSKVKCRSPFITTNGAVRVREVG